MKWKIHRLTVSQLSDGVRLDQFLASECPELSRTSAKKVIDLGGVHLDGRRVRSCSRLVKSGNSIEVYLDKLPLEPYRISDGEILFQDRYLIVINKPALIDTQPTHARFKGTIYEALQHHLQDPFRLHVKPELGMVQRLDRGTSGVMVFSIHQAAHKRLTQTFVEHQVVKRYLALVSGVPDVAEGEIRSCLARSRKHNLVKSVEKGGKEAITRYRVLGSCAECSLLEVDLLTGRSHQIRAHMSEQGWPLLGDTTYGGPATVDGLKLQRPLLHAAVLAFRHPVTDEQLEFTVKVPGDFSALQRRLGLPQGKDC